MPSALVFYHYFHPDDVVSAEHYADLCKGLKARGWDVTVMPCNRGCRNEARSYPRREIWEGIDIKRVWRPGFRQASFLGRLANSAWMIMAWSFAAFRYSPDVMIIGTDPVFAVVTSIPWKLIRPRTYIMHWCFDLHPEAAIASGMVARNSLPVRILRPILRKAYRACSRVGSIGPCMTQRLRDYEPMLPIDTFTPWALSEPLCVIEPDPEERRLVFGDAELTLMYSGNFGQAHSFELILALARKLRSHDSIRFAFSVRGNREKALREAVTAEDTNVSFPAFAPQERLEQRLSAADIHMVSLRAGYEGTVVPSKFQGALAAGRPILFSGPPDSAVSKWIQEYNLGWTLTEENLDNVANSLIQLVYSPEQRRGLNQSCFEVYQKQFSRTIVIDHLDKDLKAMVGT